jgi:threonine/homoserine/homoserine lactone efflux protein
VLVSFLPIAAVLTVTPGVSTVLVIRRAAISGRRAAFATTLGNEAGVLLWAIAAGLGLAAVVAASAVLFTAVKLVGAAVLIVLGVRALVRRSSEAPAPIADGMAGGRSNRPAFRDGLVTAIANPKLAAFYVALFPQFVPHGSSIFLASVFMGALLVLLDLVWYSALAALVARAASTFLQRWLRRAERLCGAVLVGLGIRLALEQR